MMAVAGLQGDGFRREHPVRQLAVADASGYDQVKCHLANNEPLLLKGAAWGLLGGDLTDRGLARVAGHLRVDVETSRTDRFGHEEPGWRATSMGFAAFLRTYRARRRQRIYAVTPLSGPLAEACTLPTWMPGRCLDSIEQVMLWLGAGGQISLVHNDHRDNFLCVFAGKKQVTLIDGVHGNALYERRSLRDKVSPVDIDNPDVEQFPDFRRVPMLRADVMAGDVLYIPVCWFHQVHSVGRNLAINIWFDYHDIHTRLGGTGGAGLASAEVLQRLLSAPAPAPTRRRTHPIRLVDLPGFAR